MKKYNAVFISDIHIGSNGCKAELLTAFLKSIEAKKLYIVGDLIDFWFVRRRHRWPESHNSIIRRLFKMSKHEIDIIYVPGNHDEIFRDFAGLLLGHIRIQEFAIHEALNGEKYLVIHGDKNDIVMQKHPTLSFISGFLYNKLVKLNNWINRYRERRGKLYWSFSSQVKKTVKRKTKFINKFEYNLALQAIQEGLNGVIAGHIHIAAMEEIEVNNKKIKYFNCGDWTEDATALVEHLDGRWEIINFAEGRKMNGELSEN